MKKKKLLKICIENELSAMKENVVSNFKDNIENRKKNPFLCINNKNIKKYMALGRSVDSQLGNRVQRIIFYCARLRYGNQNVPNIMLVNYVEECSEVIVKLYSVPLDVDKSYLKKDADLYSQKIYFNNDLSFDAVKKKLKLKKHSDCLSERILRFRVSEEDAELFQKKKEMLVDLLFFATDENIKMFEIKMGGNLDTKNSKSNAEEVKLLKESLSFVPTNQAFFATCYGECSSAVKNKLSDEDILNGLEFWEEVLPEEISYEEFIDIFRKIFKKVKIEKALKELVI